jgi:hypothetical protein
MAQIDAAGISSVFAPITMELATLGSRATLYVPSFDMSGSDGPNVEASRAFSFGRLHDRLHFARRRREK